jgi:hypothetical protein
MVLFFIVKNCIAVLLPGKSIGKNDKFVEGEN